MDRAALLALYDRHERIDARPYGFDVERTAHVVRHLGPPGGRSWVIHADLSGADVDAVLAGERAYFAARGGEVEWKHFAHDRPTDLRERLAAVGFVPEEREELLALDLREAPAWVDEPIAHDVSDHGPEGWDAVVGVLLVVWPELADGFVERFGAELRSCPERIRLFLARVDGAPAAAAWTVRSGPDTPFLGLFGGATLPRHRGRGLYRALVAARARHARSVGARYLTVDAGPMSAPILRRLGFVRLTTTTPCVLRTSAAPA